MGDNLNIPPESQLGLLEAEQTDGNRRATSPTKGLPQRQTQVMASSSVNVIESKKKKEKKEYR